MITDLNVYTDVLPERLEAVLAEAIMHGANAWTYHANEWETVELKAEGKTAQYRRITKYTVIAYRDTCLTDPFDEEEEDDVADRD